MKHSDRLGYGWGMDRHKKPQERSRYTFPGADTPAITINRNKKHAFSYKTVQQSGYEKAVGVRLGYLSLEKMKKPLKIKGFRGGRNRTRTCDPIDVNDVLYQLSHATIYVIRFLGLATHVTSMDTQRIGSACSGCFLTARNIIPQNEQSVNKKMKNFCNFPFRLCG